MMLYFRLILLLLIFSQALKGQFNCLFEHFSTEDGLSHGSVGTMLKDSKGFMWFGTWDGINRFDGNSFKSYKPEPGDNNILTSYRVILMVEDHWSNIWVRTYDSKVYRFNRQKEIFENILGDDNLDFNFKATSILSSSSGEVWISTEGSGIYCVVTQDNDLRTKIFHYSENSDNTFRIKSDSVSFIFEDNKNDIWVNTSKGLSLLTKKNDIYNNKPFSGYEKGFLDNYSVTSFLTKGNTIFFGTEEGEIIEYNTRINKMSVLSFNNKSKITNLNYWKRQAIIAGTSGNGIFLYDLLKKNTSVQFIDKFLKNIINTYVDSLGFIWAETNNTGIIKIDADNGTIKQFVQNLDVYLDLQPTRQCSFFQGSDRILWLTLKGGGFGYYNPSSDKVEYFFNQPGDPFSKMSNFVNTLYMDPSGVLWLSTYFTGIEKITFIPEFFHIFQPNPGFNNIISNEVRAVYEDSKGLLWVGTKKQEIFVLDKNYTVLKKINSFNGEEIGMVYTITEDKYSNIWIGTKFEGLYKLRRTGLLQFKIIKFKHNPDDPYSLSGNNIYSVIEDKKGNIWAGTYGGGINLLLHGNDEGVFYNCENSFKNYPENVGEQVRQVREDVKGNIWLATTDGLILCKDTAEDPNDYEFYRYSKIPNDIKSLGNNDVYTIFSDDTDTIWIGTLGGGLHKMTHYPDENQGVEFRVFTSENGLSSDVILTIEEDNNHNLWMSTENGVIFFNRKDELFRSFNKYDGLKYSGFSESASGKRKDGSICFGTKSGLYYFYPEEFKEEEKKVYLALTKLQILNHVVHPGDRYGILEKTLDETEDVTLKHNQSFFNIEFVGLDYKIQHKLQYSYILEGFENEWHHVKNRQVATYTDIPPGDYIFKVRFENTELQKLNIPRELKITILPPPWKTKWALIIYILISLILLEIIRRIIITILHLRNKVIIEKELSEAKLKFFTNISHELRTPLTLISGPANELLRNEKLTWKGMEYVGLIEKNTRRMLRLITQLLDFRKIQHEKMKLKLSDIDIVQFTREIFEHFIEMAEEKRIRYSFRTEIEKINVWFDEEKIDTVVFNLLSNAFKFTSDGMSISVNIALDKECHIVKLEVADEGIGIPKEKEDMMFKSFANIHELSDVKYAGTGIGLSLSKELIDLHKGKIYFKNNEERGVTFFVELKLGIEHFDNENVIFLNQVEKHATEPWEIPEYNEQQEFPETNSALLLIIEDNSDLRKFLENLLKDEYRVETARDGKEGYDKAVAINPDIIISDIMMPEKDGIELTADIKNNMETSHIPIILLTAKSSVASKIEGLKYGADAYLTKPFNSMHLKAQINNLLEQRKQLLEKFTGKVKVSYFPDKDLVVTDNDAIFIEKVSKIINENLSNPDFKIEVISKYVGMGRTGFFNKIKGLTGLSPIDFVKEFKLNKAVQFLESGKFNVSEVSYMVGFNDPGYFSKCFREKFKMSPSSFVKTTK